MFYGEASDLARSSHGKKFTLTAGKSWESILVLILFLDGLAESTTRLTY